MDSDFWSMAAIVALVILDIVVFGALLITLGYVDRPEETSKRQRRQLFGTFAMIVILSVGAGYLMYLSVIG